MEKDLISTKSISIENHDYTLKYNITTSCIYGIEVEKTTKGIKESKIYSSISYNYDNVVKLINLLSKGDVTPCTLDDILQDLELNYK